MFEDLDRLDNGECTEMYSLPGECFPRMSTTTNRNSHDNLELLESEATHLSVSKSVIGANF
jgi:hypothetical protein